MRNLTLFLKELEDTQKRRKSKTDRQYNDQMKKKTKGHTMIYKTLHRKL
jgi:hypothetical protein